MQDYTRSGIVMPAAGWGSDPDLPPPGPREPRRWRDKFREALRGVKAGVRGHSSFSVHFFFAALVVTGAAVLGFDWVEWCLVLGCIGMVIAAELFNSAVELLFRGLTPTARDEVYRCLEIAAGAVLVASLTAATVGTIVFARRVLILCHVISA